MAPDLGGKRLQLLKELLAEQTLGIEVQTLEIREPADIDGAFEGAMGQRTDALITVEDPLTIDLRKKIAEYAADHRLPTISGLKVFADAGALMSYGADLADILRRSVAYVDKILKGAKPADLPVEQPTKFELVINLKTAKSLGLTIPPLLLARADEVIE
jgi:putative ABC transport system substrate-binding protein